MSCLASHALRVRHGWRNEINKALTGTSRDQAVHRSDGRVRSATEEYADSKR